MKRTNLSTYRDITHRVAKRSVLYFILAAILLALAIQVPLYHDALAARDAQSAPSPASSSEPPQPIDVVVVLDDSGSMATCWPWPRTPGQTPFYPPCSAPSSNDPSDPENLRYSAARLLVQLADAEDRMAVIRFDTVAEGVGELGDMRIIGSEQNRQSLIQSIQPPTDYFRRGYTRLDLGLELAMQLLENVREPNRNQYIVLLTDGEPTHPNGPAGIEADIRTQVDELVTDEVLTFPVVLCNPTAGCQGEFLREVFADYGISEATTAESILRIFGEIQTEMKPNRSIIRSNGDRLALNTRTSQAVNSMSFVTERNGLLQLSRDGQPAPAQTTMDDANIDVTVVDTPGGQDSQWSATMTDSGGFVVVATDSYPELLSPPPSIADSPASTRYYPEEKSPFLLARGVGPAAGETLLYNGQTPMQPFGTGNLYALKPAEDPGAIRLQLGEDKQELELVRSFRVEPRENLPLVEVLSPLAGSDARLADGRMRLEVGFDGRDRIKNIEATVYVFEATKAGSAADYSAANLVHTAPMLCGERICTDESFLPQDGHNYEAIFIVEGEVDDIRFGDWAQATIELEPAVYLRGLPEQLDLSAMPEGGWPVDLTSGTVDEIGMLSADIVLRNAETDEVVKDVALNFMQDVPEEGTLSTTLLVEGLRSLRPGEYTGEITLSARSPAGLPFDVRIRPAPEIPVNLSVPRPVAIIRSQSLDFGDVLFDTSPNFRLNEEASVTVDFSGSPFPLTAELVGDECAGLSVVAGEAENLLGNSVIPLRLSSQAAVEPGACAGEIRFSGPDADYDVIPSSVDWQLRVSDVEWSLVDSALNLGDLQDAGTRIDKTLQIRFSGKTPFLVELEDIEVVGSNVPDGAPTRLSSDYIDMPPVEVSGPPQEDGTYLVPVTMIARQAIPFDPLRGTFYSGQLGLRIAGLDDAAKPVNFAFRSPSVYQRYAAPIIEPVYSMPWVLCTAPMTLLLLLVLLARTRGRNFDQDEVEQAAMAKAVKSIKVDQPETEMDEPLRSPATPATASWGGSEWGSAWTRQAGAGRVDEDQAATKSKSPSTNGNGNGASSDPWSSSW